LQQQRRTAQYRFQADYLERSRQQQISFRNERDHDYDHDPYFYTAPIYRYRRAGRYYEVNQYGADMLRQAVNYGYSEGYRTGQADRQDRWHSNYQGSYAYQDASYGYSGFYVDQSQYNYYFRQGFRRGYQDGYRSRYQYGRYSNGTYSVRINLMGAILGFESLR
jgi:flagellar biosynthesis/type III secretory pathway protein FliH